ncbi:MAG TPA: methyltransferase [Puia sp.]|jgi:tRNA1Val (adenine37-N6)-methyltransferase|nr:methyltransferase [Puia sp.]
MRNGYFQFKQFTVHQNQCAMKVCTDACILGAWFADKTPAYARVLDIGSGTGLLMLMLAQKHKGTVHGIEIDLDAFHQLKENIGGSPWRQSLKVYPGDVRSFTFPDKFDFIISNPPFFENDLPASSAAANLARHSKELTLSELLEAIDANLSHKGSFGVLLPYHRTAWFEEQAATGHGFTLREKLLVRQTPRHDFFRSILYLSRHRDNFVPTTELTIQDETGAYTEDFIELMQDYYLNFPSGSKAFTPPSHTPPDTGRIL